MRKTPPFVLLLCTLVYAGAAGAPKGAQGEATFAPVVRCGEHGEQAFARGLAGESPLRAAMLVPGVPGESPWPAPDPRDTGLEAFARCRTWDGGVFAAVGTST